MCVGVAYGFAATPLQVRVHVCVRMHVHPHMRVGMRGRVQRVLNVSALERSRVLRMRVCGNVNVCEYASLCSSSLTCARMPIHLHASMQVCKCASA